MKSRGGLVLILYFGETLVATHGGVRSRNKILTRWKASGFPQVACQQKFRHSKVPSFQGGSESMGGQKFTSSWTPAYAGATMGLLSQINTLPFLWGDCGTIAGGLKEVRVGLRIDPQELKLTWLLKPSSWSKA